jgi:hypothetical protein
MGLARWNWLAARSIYAREESSGKRAANVDRWLRAR